jgi:hypothetical protein
MPLIVTVSVGSSRARIEVSDIQKDALLPQNVVLVGCRELAMEGVDEREVTVQVWSVPASSVEGYIICEYAAPVSEVTQATAEPLPPPVGIVDPLEGMTDEQREAVRRRQSELREIDRAMTAELRSRKASTAATVAEATQAPTPEPSQEQTPEPTTEPAPDARPAKARSRKGRTGNAG